MFAGGAGLVFGNQNTVTEPLTHDPGANAFLAQIDLTLEADQQLRTLDEAMRLKVLSVLHSKMSQTTIQNPSTYLLGIMRNEKKPKVPTSRMAGLLRTGGRHTRALSRLRC
jgi:hypothetical protein